MDGDAPAAGRRRRYRAWPVIALVLIAAGVLVLAALGVLPSSRRDVSEPGGAPARAPATAAPSTPAPAPPPVRFVAVGDSITVAGGDIPGGHFTDLSWVRYAVGAPMIPYGGWAVSGATTAQMAAGFAPPAGEPYVLVILAGTNDVGLDLPFSVSGPNLVAIADRAKDATRIFVTAIPPLTGREAQAARYNAELAALAAERGWTFVDPMAAVSADGRWIEGMTHDGIHPTAQGAQHIGAGIRAAVLAP